MAKDRAVCVDLIRDFGEHFVTSEGAVPGFTILGLCCTVCRETFLSLQTHPTRKGREKKAVVQLHEIQNLCCQMQLKYLKSINC